MKNPKYDIEMKTYWDTFTDPYQMGPQKHRVYLLDMLKDYGVERLLDVGCGTGPIYDMIKNMRQQNPEDHLESIPRYLFTYKGTDFSPAMIAIAKEQFPEGDFEVQDARRMTEPDNAWDCVLLLHCLDHVDDYQAVIREAARVAVKYVCIVLWRGFVGEGTHLNDRNMMGKTEGEQPWEDTHLQEYSKETIEKAFADAGLTIEVTIDGPEINSDASHYNFIYLLKKP